MRPSRWMRLPGPRSLWTSEVRPAPVGRCCRSQVSGDREERMASPRPTRAATSSTAPSCAAAWSADGSGGPRWPMSSAEGSVRWSVATTSIRCAGAVSRDASSPNSLLAVDARQQHHPQRRVGTVEIGCRYVGAVQRGEHRRIAGRPTSAPGVTEQEELPGLVVVAVDVDGPGLATGADEVAVGAHHRGTGGRLDPRAQLVGQVAVDHQRKAVTVVRAAATSASLVTTTVGLWSMSMKVCRSAQCSRPASVSV